MVFDLLSLTLPNVYYCFKELQGTEGPNLTPEFDEDNNVHEEADDSATEENSDNDDNVFCFLRILVVYFSMN